MMGVPARHANIPIFVPHAGCPHHCSFCNQKTISGAQTMPGPEDVTALCAEALLRLDSRYTTEIAFFGGSFTAIPREKMTALLQAAAVFVEKGQAAGIRISTRPDAIDGAVLSILSRYHVTTIELGAQSMDDAALLQNGRGHTATDVATASGLIKAKGFTLGLQMMTGLYGDNRAGVWATARALAALEPAFVRIYPVVVLNGTRLADLYKAGLYTPPGVDESAVLCAELIEFFESKSIPVIRAGLHSSELVGSQAIAGAYHPAFRELCESRIFYTKLQYLLSKETLSQGRQITVFVAPQALSAAIGHNRCNVKAFASLGYHLAIRSDAGLTGREMRLEPTPREIT